MGEANRPVCLEIFRDPHFRQQGGGRRIIGIKVWGSALNRFIQNNVALTQALRGLG